MPSLYVNWKINHYPTPEVILGPYFAYAGERSVIPLRVSEADEGLVYNSRRGIYYSDHRIFAGVFPGVGEN